MKPSKEHRYQSGVTLVELSIVLTIIALLIGGVLAGTSLIKTLELRAVINESQKYQAAVSIFKQKYDQFPGDFTDAVAIWGMAPNAASAAASDAACAALTEESQGTRTCNGDGSLTIDAGSEEFRAWQQLNIAGMLPEKFTGVGSHSSTAGVGIRAGTNTPMSDLRSAGWRVFYLSNTTASGGPTFFNGDYDVHVFSHWGSSDASGGNNLASDGNLNVPTLFPEEMAQLDNKFDDGAPATGNIFTHASDADIAYDFYCATKNNTSTAASQSDIDAVYRTTEGRRDCQFYVRAKF